MVVTTEVIVVAATTVEINGATNQVRAARMEVSVVGEVLVQAATAPTPALTKRFPKMKTQSNMAAKAHRMCHVLTLKLQKKNRCRLGLAKT